MTFARTATAGFTDNASSTSVAASSFTSVAGRPIAGYIGWEGGNTTASVADTAGNNYVVGTPIPHDIVPDQVIAPFYCLSSLGHASNVVTATFGAARSVRIIQLAEYSTAGPVSYDGTANGYSTSSGAITTGSITTTAAVGLIFVGAKAYHSTAFSSNAPTTLIAQSGNYGATGERFLTSAGTYTASLLNSLSSFGSIVALAFKEGASGPTVTTITGITATEGSAIVHTVTLSGATSGSTDYAATLVGVNATGGGTDFTSDLASATYSNGVTFSGGNMVVPDAVSSWTVTISTAGDALDEVNETYTLTVGGVSGTGTITDDDAQPTVTISDATEVAGTVTFVATLSAASGKTITFVADTANGTKTAGVDYTALTGSTVTFNPGETTKNIVVTAL